MDWADDVAYALHDLDDFARAGLIPLERLAQDEGEQKYFLGQTHARWTKQGRVIEDWKLYEDTANALFAEFPVGRAASEAMPQLLSAKANLYASGLKVEGVGLAEDPKMKRELDLLKELTWTYVIESPALAAQQEGQRTIVERLFEYYLDAATNCPHALPAWTRRSLDTNGANHEQRVRAASDTVAALSETQATAIYARVTGIQAGSIHDLLGV
jgi:dGTPase